MRHVCIIGGGISGLAAAYYLSRRGCRCTLIEREARLGGVIRTEHIEGCVVEGGPDSFLSQKPWALALIRELGIERDVIGSNDHLRQTYILRRGRLIPMPEGLYLMIPTAMRPILTTRLLGWRTKLRMAADMLRRPAAGRAEEPGPGEDAESGAPFDSSTADVSAASFLRAHYGDEAVDYLAEPLLAGIYGGDAADLSARSVLPRLVELERRYGSLTRGALASRAQAAGSGSEPQAIFLSLRGGMQQLVDALARAIAGRVAVLRGEAERIEETGEGCRIFFGGQWIEASDVIVAAPAYIAGRLLQAVEGCAAELLSGVRYHSSLTVSLGYNRAHFSHPLNGFGFLTPKVERRRLTACTWVGTKFPNRVTGRRVLLRGFIGAGNEGDLLQCNDEELVEGVREELAQYMGVAAAPEFFKVYRWPRAMAQYNVGHERRIAEIQRRLAPFRWLHLAGNAYSGIGIPDCIRTAKSAADRVLAAPAEAAPLAHTNIKSGQG
ncbi:MAG TPA: protoporphyrinogen oxidase [Bryobacterales bacterium]|nr:protoporphyrinogen oxidase [Bryobacterales bacterium]